MAYRISPDFADDVAHFGGETITKCFNCGNCTAICGLSREDATFPRRYIRYMQLGLKDKAAESLEPWLCYYCGDCSETCPREAEPGELMMAARRWLTARYDWTGLGLQMYRSAWAEIGALLAVALIVLLLFVVPENFGFKLLAASGTAPLQNVDLAAFAPKHIVHYGDIVMALILFTCLAINSIRMVQCIMRNHSARLGDYLIEIPLFFGHLFTQKRWGECEKGAIKHWIRHLFLVTGYATMFLLVVVFLLTFQVEDTSWHWTSLLGYYATVILLLVPGWMLIDRMLKRDAIHEYSHLSDWGFPALLFLTGLTGIIMHLFRLINWPMATYITYLIHLMIAVPMLVIEVPFGKWAHLVYRPLGIYLKAVQTRVARRAPVPSHAGTSLGSACGT